MIKKYTLVLIALLCAFVGFGQVSENFDGWTDNSYGDVSTYSSASGNWVTNNSICNATNARTGRAVRFNDDSGENEYLLYSGLDGNGKDNGIGDISFWYRHWNGDSSIVQFQTQYSTNGGTTWINVAGVISATSIVYNQFSSTVNLSGDDILIRVISIDDSERLMIDDFEITNFTCTDAVDFERLVSPAVSPDTITQGNPFLVTTLATEPGVTGVAGGAPDLEAWIGYSTTDNDPSTSAGWTWIPAIYSGGAGNTDEHTADIGTGLTSGTYYYASRHRLNGCEFTYGGNVFSGSFWNNNSQVLIVEPNLAGFCAFESFNNSNATSTYSDNSFIGDNGITWTYIESRDENGDANNSGINGNALMLRSSSDNSRITSSLVPNGIAEFTVKLYKGFTGTGNRQVELFVNGISQGTSMPFDDYNEHIFSVAGINITGDVSIELRNITGSHIIIDDIKWTCYTPCTPTHTITSFSPTSGPENTEVTITGSNFTANSTVNFNGASATIISQSSTELVVSVPSGASSGILTVIESGCEISSTDNFTIIDAVNDNCEGNVSASDLFISEITDATYGSLTYVEIYNGTGMNIPDLSIYSLEITFNGNSNNTTSINLSGALAAGGVHVVSTNTGGFECSGDGDGGLGTPGQPNLGNGIDSGKNDADCITLYKNTTIVDVWGVCNDKNWRENLGIAIGDEGFDFRRLTTSNPPSTTFNASDWEIIDWADGASNSTCSTNDYSNIGSYASGLPPNIMSQPSISSVCNATISLSTTATEGNLGGLSIAYQWYYLAPNNANWELVTDNSVFTGANNATLNINNPLSVLDYQFYCQIREDDVTCFNATNAVKIDLVKTTWNGSSWDNGIPDTNKIAVIDGDYNTTSGSFSACQLLVNNGHTLTVSDSKYVEVVNNVLVNGQLNVETKGAFVQNNDLGTFLLGANGSSQVNKFTAPLPEWRAYTYWSSPVTNTTAGEAFPFSVRQFYFDAFNYIDNDGDGLDDNANDWVALDATNTLTPGVGYIASHTSIGFTAGNSYQYNFVGPFNTGNVNVATSYVSTNPNNWNLVGNPYPCAINVDEFFNVNYNNGNGVIQGIVYLWSHHSAASDEFLGNDVLNYSISDYALINLAGETAGASGKTPGRYIPSGQSFFATTINNSGNLGFNNAMRIAQENNNELFFRNSSFKTSNTQNTRQKIRLNLTTQNGVFNQILISYLESATNAYDGIAYDAEPVYTGWGNIYTSIEGERYQLAIQGKSLESLTLEERIPIGFNNWIEDSTLYTIELPETKGDFFEENNVYLNDYLLNTTHNLSDSNYSFTSEYGVFPDRFEIVFKTSNSLSTKNNALDNSLKIIELDNGNVEFILDGNLQLKHITIIDILGRNLYSIETSGNSKIFNLENINTGTYIAKVTLSDDTIITKKAIKRL